ncbi:HD domain-containing protein [Chitinophaga flava]|uniref:HD-CE domain-containing protein n=1 Tax=Chitinophaga flava TaxID=2259036 RepID=A0A365Y0A9_9BACT|nr:ATP-binding protein [Chitinophaga flava]RBL91691.1 hypothetical protein DF182_03520 [Chitinophaga flava]
MPKSNWKNTSLFRELEKRKGDIAKKLVVFLEQDLVMDTIESILDKGGTTPKDFTLHDSDHSFRVANRMWELIPDLTRKHLSEYEIAFLLLSAYLHDIGMSPDFELVLKHKEFLTTMNKEGLSEHEIDELQKWIDNEPKTLSINIAVDKIDDPKLSDYILSYYVRHKHNDWSGKWIQDHLGSLKLYNYLPWSDDLIKVCKSHHYGIEHLSSELFDPKPIGGGIVHLRYMAICLRVADILENDPERTPDVILKHRMINVDSLKYWLKDRRFSLTRQDNMFSIYARPEKAYLHKAIEDTANAIEQELKLCDELVKVKPLNHSSFAKFSHYLWNIDAYVHRDISPKEDTYVYIQGAFKPNTAKILELLGGNQLYGDPIWALRELIQNSYDSVRERIAYQIINEDKDPNEFLKKFGDLYAIDISLDEKEDGVWLVCKDQGVGMTKAIIEKFFLESGSSRRYEIKELERKCSRKGFKLNRTGQFGIGVLSYFMLADKIIVKTKRELNTGYKDEDSAAWRFEINGAHDFGELIKYNKANIGTVIELKLKRFIESDIEKWDNKIRNFINANISRSPCEVSYKSYLNKEPKIIKQGWHYSKADIVEKVVANARRDMLKERDYENEIISSKEREAYEKNYLFREECVMEMSDMIGLLVEEGEIEELGKYRIHIPYFKLSLGNSFVYFKEKFEDQKNFIQKFHHGYHWNPHFGGISFSLKGIAIKVTDTKILENRSWVSQLSFAYIEVDIESINDTAISVSRHGINATDILPSLYKTLKSKCFSLISDHKELFNNNYGLVNYFYTRDQPKDLFWFYQQGAFNQDTLMFDRLKMPLCDPPVSFSLMKNLKYNDQTLYCIGNLDSLNRYLKLNLFDKLKCNFRIGFVEDKPRLLKKCVPVLMNYSFIGYRGYARFDEIELPEHLNDVLLFTSDRFDRRYGEYLINNKHNLFKYFDYMDFLEIRESGVDIEMSRLSNAVSCFSFLLNSVIGYYKGSWIGLCEKKEDIIKHVFSMLGVDEVIILTAYKEVAKISPGHYNETSLTSSGLPLVSLNLTPSFYITGEALFAMEE